MKHIKVLIVFIIFAIQCNGLKIFCETYENGCYVDIESTTKVDSKFLDMLTSSQRNDVNKLLYNSSYKSYQKRNEINYLINKNVSQEVFKKYKTEFPNEIDEENDKNLGAYLMFQPCSPFCFNPHSFFKYFWN